MPDDAGPVEGFADLLGARRGLGRSGTVSDWFRASCVSALCDSQAGPLSGAGLALAWEVLGGPTGSTAVLNAANEVAVDAFLESRIRFLDICRIVEEAMASLEGSSSSIIAQSPASFAEVAAVDQAARDVAQRIAVSLAAA